MKVCVYGDFLEEDRLSMEICGTKLTQFLPAATFHIPSLRHYLPKHPLTTRSNLLINRHFTYSFPRELFDIHHVIDHSYAHLLHRLPLNRSIVTCHDLNIYYRMQQSRNPLFQASCTHILSGLRKARWVLCDSQFTRLELEKANLTQGELKVIPLGVDGDFRVLPAATVASVVQKYNLPALPTLLHVGSCDPRKNIEGLLQLVGQLRQHQPIHLLKVGGQFSPEHQRLIRDLDLGDQLTHLPKVATADLVALYNHATVLVFPSWLEGFGFPVLEALACGTPVVASNCSSIPELPSRIR